MSWVVRHTNENSSGHPCLRDFSLVADDKISVRLGTLAAIPRDRQAALVSYAIAGSDSTPAISAKRQAYFAALKGLADKLRKEYYWHDQFPSNVFAGIEDRAEVLVATHYPASPTTGASYVQMLRDDYMNQMAEEVVISMAREICIRSKQRDIRVVGQPSAISFESWQREWISAGTVNGAPKPKGRLTMENGPKPNQPVQRTRASRSAEGTNRTSSAAGSRR